MIAHLPLHHRQARLSTCSLHIWACDVLLGHDIETVPADVGRAAKRGPGQLWGKVVREAAKNLWVWGFFKSFLKKFNYYFFFRFFSVVKNWLFFVLWKVMARYLWVLLQNLLVAKKKRKKSAVILFSFKILGKTIFLVAFSYEFVSFEVCSFTCFP